MLPGFDSLPPIKAVRAFVLRALGYDPDSRFVHLSGAESVADQKIFTSSPLVPTLPPGDSTLKAASTAFATAAAAAAVSAYRSVTLSPSQATTSGTFKDFTGIPATAKRVTAILSLVSTSGSDQVCIQLGTASGYEALGYQGSSGYINAIAGNAVAFNIGAASLPLGAAVATRSGEIVFTNISGDTWVFSGFVGNTSSGDLIYVAGTKTLAGTLNSLRLTTLGGTDVFDGGAIAISYES